MQAWLHLLVSWESIQPFSAPHLALMRSHQFKPGGLGREEKPYQTHTRQDQCTHFLFDTRVKKAGHQALVELLLIQWPGAFYPTPSLSGRYPAAEHYTPALYFSQPTTRCSEAGRSFCFIFFNRFLF